MARSSYIYVVPNDEGLPFMAFTVKHELVSWLRRNGHDDIMCVFRLPDGRESDAGRVELDPEELMQE